MPNEEREAVSNLKESLSNLITYDAEDMYTRAEWGSKLTFEPYKEDFDRTFNLAKIFINLPFHLLPDAQLNQIKAPVSLAVDHFTEINELDISTVNNAQQTVQTLGEQVKTHADSITVQVAPWISYLAYQNGDVAKNLTELESAISVAETTINEAKGRVDTEEKAIKRIVQQAQDFAGDKGVTIFTEQFDNAASDNGTEAGKWLNATMGAFTVTILTIVAFMFTSKDVTTWFEWASRAALIAVLVTGAIWCGKTYRILRHQQTTNQHKANGLKSFLLFRDAADNDEATRNAVLLETTRSIFSSNLSGFIPESSVKANSGIQVIDASRALGTVNSVAKSKPD